MIRFLKFEMVSKVVDLRENLSNARRIFLWLISAQPVQAFIHTRKYSVSTFSAARQFAKTSYLRKRCQNLFFAQRARDKTYVRLVAYAFE